MFIAHIPAGYLLTSSLQRKFRWPQKSLMFTGLAATALPDFDMLYFYMYGDPLQRHHEYFTHFPLFWLALALAAALFCTAAGKRWMLPYIAVGLACILLHMMMDSVISYIHWLAPFSDMKVQLFTVPIRYQPRIINYFLHWTFSFEILIITLAAGVWLRRRREAETPPA